MRLPRKKKKIFTNMLRSEATQKALKQSLLDDLIFGISGFHVDNKTKKIERVHPMELYALMNKYGK